MRVAEEGPHAEAVQPVMTGELGAVVEGEGVTQGRRQGGEDADELLGDGAGCLARRARGDDQARVALMQGEDGLAISGEEHEIGLPIAGAAAPGDLGRAFGDGEAVLDEAGRAAALAAAKAAPALAARQEVAPAIV